MFVHKSLSDEGIRSTSIEEYSCRVGVDWKCTKRNVRSLHRGLNHHVVHISLPGSLGVLAHIVLLRLLVALPPVRALISIVIRALANKTSGASGYLTGTGRLGPLTLSWLRWSLLLLLLEVLTRRSLLILATLLVALLLLLTAVSAAEAGLD